MLWALFVLRFHSHENTKKHSGFRWLFLGLGPYLAKSKRHLISMLKCSIKSSSVAAACHKLSTAN